jgi:hypothetical protein
MKKVCPIIILMFLFVNLNAQSLHQGSHDDYGFMMITPDSLLSKDMLQTKHQLIFYFFFYTNVVGDRLVYIPDNNNESYKKLPKLYIEHIIRNIDDLNGHWPDSIARNDFMKSFPKMKKDVLTKLSEMKDL